MLPGYNHNVGYRGRTLHVQTEDAGPGHPHVTTHLFLAGTILATARTAYAELLTAADREAQVRQLMQRQHQDMLRRLTRGEHDAAIARAAAAAPPT